MTTPVAYIRRPHIPADVRRRFSIIQEVSEAWADLISSDAVVASEAVEAYRQRAGTCFTSPDARALVPQFAQSADYRTLYNKALDRFTHAVLRKAIRARLGEPSLRDTVVIVAGGTASGKSITLSDVVRHATRQPHLVWDTTAKRVSQTAEIIELALARHKLVALYFVYRPFAQAAKASVLRALADSASLDSGKTIHPRGLANAHYHAPHVFREFQRRYADDHRVSFAFVDNRYAPGAHRIYDTVYEALLGPLLERSESEMAAQAQRITEETLDAAGDHPRRDIVRFALALADQRTNAANVMA